MAKAAKGGKKGAAAAATPGKGAKDENTSGGLGVIPVNYMKDGSHPPVKPDEEYPSWLWELKLPSMPVLNRIAIDDMTLPEMRRLVQLQNRAAIKDSNADPSF